MTAQVPQIRMVCRYQLRYSGKEGLKMSLSLSSHRVPSPWCPCVHLISVSLCPSSQSPLISVPLCVSP